MRKYLIMSAATLLLSSGYAFAADAGVLSDSDIPALRDALKKSYTLELCHKDLPDATVSTCDCLGQEMAKNLSGPNLLLCKKDGYDDCVATEFTAAKSALSEKQINDCKALVKADVSAPAPAAAPAAATENKTESTDAVPAATENTE